MIKTLKELYKNGRIVGKANYEFTPEMASSIGGIHGTFFNPNESIVMGRDYHNDSRMLKRGYTSGLMSTGVNLLNLGESTYPLLQFTVRRFGASGGVYFSAGHLYSEDVGVRFVDAGGIEFAPVEIQKIIDDYENFEQRVRRVDPSNIGRIIAIPQTEDIYVKSLAQFVDKKKIQKENLKIVVDCSYGPAGKSTPPLLNEMGVETIALNTYFKDRARSPVPNINTIRNTADIVKASNSQLGVCFDVDGSRILVIDENGLEVNFEDLFMLFVGFEEKIVKSRGNTIVVTPNIPLTVRKFIEQSGYPVIEVENHPGEISRKLREERACFGAADTLKFYFPQYSPFSDGNFILLKILEIMANQDDLLSSLIKGFPKGIKLNRTIPLLPEVIEKFHNELHVAAEHHGYKYRDIINELKIVDDNKKVSVSIKLSLYRNAVLLSAESENVDAAKDMIRDLEKLISELS